MKSEHSMKVHLYKISTAQESLPLTQLLQKIEQAPLVQRIRTLKYPIRLEAAQKPSAEQRYWLLDFAKLRYDGGPGRASAKKATESFDLEEGEGFSEETAVLYCPATGYAAVQYNHHGPRVSAISDYLGVFDVDALGSYEFQLKLKEDAQARLDNKTIFTHLEMQVAPGKLSEAFKKNNVSLTSMLKQQADSFGGDYVTITVGLHGRKSSFLSLAKWVPTFKKMANEEEDAVTRLQITGKSDVNSPLDLVDLISEKVHLEFKGLALDEGLRYVREGRWKALSAAYHDWKGKGLMT